MPTRRATFVLSITLGIVVLFCGLRWATSDEKKRDSGRPPAPFGSAFFKPLIETGSNADTLAYYGQIGPVLGLPLIVTDSSGNPNLNPNFGLDQLIAFAGFSDGNGAGLLASDADSLAGLILND